VSDPRIIPIGAKARLVVSSTDVCVEERKISAAGKERWGFCGSYGSLRAAAESFVTGRNVGVLLPEQISGVSELIAAIDIAAATVGTAVERAEAKG
jgi:hypothetical protein